MKCLTFLHVVKCNRSLLRVGWGWANGEHTVPAQKSNISKKIIGGRSLTFSFLKIIRRLLLFARLSYYFTPYNRLTDYSLQVHKLKKSSTLLSFWPAGFIPPPNDWKLTDIFFPIWTLWVRCVPKYRMWWALGDLSTTSGGMGWVSSRDGKHANSKNIFVLFWGAGASLGVLHKF